MFACLYAVGEKLCPQRSTEKQLSDMYDAFNYLGWDKDKTLHIYASWAALTGFSLCILTSALWFTMKTLRPQTPTTHLRSQLKTIAVNLLVVLPVYESAWESLVLGGWSKVVGPMDRLEPSTILKDIALWMLVFELTWYMQHRAMHDNKTLWRYGHEYHHGWKRPEHMIGVTNFAFDAIVEGWVTMSSSFLPVLLFPINCHVRNFIGIMYTLLAVLVHWDFFPIRYHLNHHYYVTKNYGSHVPVFDMLFGTYQGEYFCASAWNGRDAEKSE